MTEALSDHKIALARELLDDVELSRLGTDALLLKARRLARLMDNTAVEEWLRFELSGYPNTDVARRFMSAMGRWEDQQKGTGYWMPLAGVEGMIESCRAQIQQLNLPNVHFAPSSANPREVVTEFGAVEKLTQPINTVLLRLNSLSQTMSKLAGVRSRALAGVHDFASRTFYELAFGSVAESVFERHREQIDTLLAATAGEAAKKIPAIHERLLAGDGEAVSQALNSCRRMIKAFADAVYPPRETTVESDGQTYQVGSDRVLNRIKLFLKNKCPSESRIDRLSRTLRDVHERASAGSHSDVSADEARTLFLLTYLTLGEILVATGQTVASLEASITRDAT